MSTFGVESKKKTNQDSQANPGQTGAEGEVKNQPSGSKKQD